MVKTVTRYKPIHRNAIVGNISDAVIAYADTECYVHYDAEPKELVSAVDYDSLKAGFDKLLHACQLISTGSRPYSSASIAYQALAAVGYE